MLLRLCMFYGVGHPHILSGLSSTTPTMDIADRGNRLFFMHSHTRATLSRDKDFLVALTPSHPNAVSLGDVDWRGAASLRPTGGVRIVLGMENGLSDEVAAQCDQCAYIPQYGSIGSLSMLSALSIALHHAASALHPDAAPATIYTPHVSSSPLSPHDQTHPCGLGHQPGTCVYAPAGTSRPHEPSMLHLSNDQIRAALAERRRQYPLQLSLLIWNELADRNIGAVIRNANVFNCDDVILINRKKFNMRGTVGTHHYTPITFYDTMKDACSGRSSTLGGGSSVRVDDDQEVWLLQSNYPYLKNHYEDPSRRPLKKRIVGKKRMLDVFETFIRHDDPELQRWMHQPDVFSEPPHPMLPYLSKAHLAVDSRSPSGRLAEVYLDDPASISRAVDEVYTKKQKRGIILAVAEEGTTPHPELANLADRIVHVVHPMRMNLTTQRGLGPALSTAIALERLRFAVDRLKHSSHHKI